VEFGDILAGQTLRPWHYHAHRVVKQLAFLRIANFAKPELAGHDLGRLAPRMP